MAPDFERVFVDMRKQSNTDWAKVKAMKDRDIDFSHAPELDDKFFAEATLWPGKKKQITIRIDPEFCKLQ